MPATPVARDRALRTLVTLAGDRHLLVRDDDERRVRTGLRKLGYAPGR